MLSALGPSLERGAWGDGGGWGDGPPWGGLGPFWERLGAVMFA